MGREGGMREGPAGEAMGRGRDGEKWEKNRRGARRKMGDGVQEREEQAGGALRAKTNETAECHETVAKLLPINPIIMVTDILILAPKGGGKVRKNSKAGFLGSNSTKASFLMYSSQRRPHPLVTRTQDHHSF